MNEISIPLTKYKKLIKLICGILLSLSLIYLYAYLPLFPKLITISILLFFLISPPKLFRFIILLYLLILYHYIFWINNFISIPLLKCAFIVINTCIFLYLTIEEEKKWLKIIIICIYLVSCFFIVNQLKVGILFQIGIIFLYLQKNLSSISNQSIVVKKIKFLVIGISVLNIIIHYCFTNSIIHHELNIIQKEIVHSDNPLTKLNYEIIKHFIEKTYYRKEEGIKEIYNTIPKKNLQCIKNTLSTEDKLICFIINNIPQNKDYNNWVLIIRHLNILAQEYKKKNRSWLEVVQKILPYSIYTSLCAFLNNKSSYSIEILSLTRNLIYTYSRTKALKIQFMINYLSQLSNKKKAFILINNGNKNHKSDKIKRIMEKQNFNKLRKHLNKLLQIFSLSKDSKELVFRETLFADRLILNYFKSITNFGLIIKSCGYYGGNESKLIDIYKLKNFENWCNKPGFRVVIYDKFKKELNSIKIFNTYCSIDEANRMSKYIKNIDLNRYLIIVYSNDESFKNINKKLIKEMRKIGARLNFRNKSRYAYILISTKENNKLKNIELYDKIFTKVVIIE